MLPEQQSGFRYYFQHVQKAHWVFLKNSWTKFSDHFASRSTRTSQFVSDFRKLATPFAKFLWESRVLILGHRSLQSFTQRATRFSVSFHMILLHNFAQLQAAKFQRLKPSRQSTGSTIGTSFELRCSECLQTSKFYSFHLPSAQSRIKQARTRATFDCTLLHNCDVLLFQCGTYL